MTLWVLLAYSQKGSIDRNVKVSAKDLQSTLKFAQNRRSNQNFNSKLGTVDYNKEKISKF
jgi:hypothetical protein